jgi:hypothetical protein
MTIGMRNPPEAWRDYLAWHTGLEAD